MRLLAENGTSEIWLGWVGSLDECEWAGATRASVETAGRPTGLLPITARQQPVEP